MSEPTSRWSEIAAQFDALVELPPAQQAERLAALERADPALAVEIRARLAADASANALLAALDALE